MNLQVIFIVIILIELKYTEGKKKRRVT